MKLKTARHGDVLVVELHGRLTRTGDGGGESKPIALFLERLEARQIHLDLRGVSDIDAYGIGQLVLTHRLLTDEQRTLKLRGIRDRLRVMLDVCGLTTRLDAIGEADVRAA